MPSLDLSTAEYTFQTQSLDAGMLRVASFTGREEMGRPYSFFVELVSDRADLDIDAQVGARAILTLYGRLPLGTRYSRHVHGVIERFELAGAGQRHSVYQATLVPTIAPLHYTLDSRIFQQMTTPDIVQKLLRAAGLPSEQIQLMLHGQYRPRDYCVQYQESDLNFFSRLLEDDGIFYFFEHKEDKEVLLLGDGPHALDTAPHAELLSHYDKPNLYEEGVHEFRALTVMRPGRVTLRDFRFKQPGLDLESKQESEHFKQLEVYQFPGRYVDPDIGSQRARIRLEEVQHDRQQFVGLSSSRALQPGYKFKLQGHRRATCNQEYLILAVEHQGSQPQAFGEEHSKASKERPNYQARVTCIPAGVPYRPPRVSPRPSILGLQTAVVVGPSGEEIHCDEHGRVKVQFHWDREGDRNDSSSCWIRVSQPWGGTSYGGMFIPRIGQEVIVQFLEGDPDRPLITGRVYNGENPVPHGLPDAKNISTIRTASTPGGGGFNELRFNDSAGGEEVFFHAQKDHNEVVNNDHSCNIGVNQSNTVGSNQTESIGANQTLTVGADRSASVAKNEKIEIGLNQTNTIGVDQKNTIGSNQKTSVGVDQALEVGSNQAVTIGTNQKVVIGGDQKVTITGSATETVISAKTLNCLESYTINVKPDMSVNVNANTSIKSGSSVSTESLVVSTGAILVDTNGTCVLTKGIFIGTSGVFISTEGAIVSLKGGLVKIEGGTVDVEGGTVSIAGGVVSVKGGPILLNS